MESMERRGFPAAPARRHTLIWLAALAAALALGAYGSVSGQAAWEAEFMQGLQAASPRPMERLAEAMTVWGKSTGYLLTAAAGVVCLLWCRQRWLAAMLIFVVALRGLSPLMKDRLDRPRPSPALVDVAHRLSDSSFPSGHVFGATLLYGFLAYAAEFAVPNIKLRRVLQSACIAMVGLMGYARMELGAHWPTDVMGGWLIGCLLLSVLVWLHQHVEPRAPAPVEVHGT